MNHNFALNKTNFDLLKNYSEYYPPYLRSSPNSSVIKDQLYYEKE